MQNKKKDFTAPDPAFAPGTHHGGFTVTKTEPIPELSACAYVFRHDKSGARALWIACADTNRSFAIAFKTPPADNTGVFHILEHSVLCGSARFPVKEPFVTLLKTSMQTFLNALTFPDKTMYPVASTNVQDLENLMDVYLDAVLHPAIYHRPRIFKQEGWHLELSGAPTSAERELRYNGVVLNEMKGALSNPDEVLFEGVNRALFPNSPYRFESGGQPQAIPTLSYEDFLDAHERHYNLANSYTIFYGDLDADREFSFVNERFCAASQRRAGAPNPLPLQAPVRPGLTRTKMATAPNKASVALAYVIGTAAQRERVLAADILLDALAGSNEAPLKRAVLDSGLGNDLTATLIDGELQPQMLFQLKGAKPDVARPFRELVETTCRELVSKGIGADRLKASLAQAEFNLREGDWGGYSDGVALSIHVMSSWLYDDNNPVAYLHYEDALAHMKTGLDSGYFERLLNELVVGSSHAAEVELVPVADGAADDERRELADKKAHMTAAELKAVDSEVAALRAEQEAPDDPEDLAKLPRLGISDIVEAPAEPEPLMVEAPLPCIAHELDTHGIAYVWHYFDLRRLNVAELPYVGLLCDLLGKLDTKHHRASELDTLVESNLGGLYFSLEAYGRDDDPAFARPMLVVGASALSEKIEALATLPSEVWGQTIFTDTDRMRDVLRQRLIALEQVFLNSGHSAALSRLNAHFSAASDATDRMGGVSYYLFLKDLLVKWDKKKQGVCEVLWNLAGRIFTSDEVKVSFAGSAEDRRRFWEAGGTLDLREGGPRISAHALQLPPAKAKDGPVHEAFVLPSDVCFVAAGGPRPDCDPGSLGSWQVASRALSFDYLWNEVRVKGGAYGVGFRHTSSGLAQFWSYRDPNAAATIKRFGHAAQWLSDWDVAPAELEGYIVSTVASHDTPLKPRQLARRQDTDCLSGHPYGWRAQIRSQELAATAKDMSALAPVVAKAVADPSVVIFGSADIIASSGLDFQVTKLIDSSEEE
jgi:Zn-dependent M16 (insulinase) family peptidase